MGLEKPTIKNIAVGAGAGILANAFAPGIGALLIRAIPSLATAIPGAIATVGSTLPTFGSVLGKGIAQAGAAGPQLPLGVIGKKEIAATAPDVPFMYGSRERGLNDLTIGALSEGYNLAEDIKRKRSMLV